MADAPSTTPAGVALSLLFKKLHPLLEDAAHLLARKAPKAELEKLHHKLVRARTQCVEILTTEAEALPEGPLRDLLETLATNLTPVEENFRESLVLTQLCLEEAPGDLLPHLPPGAAEDAPWAKRMAGFQELLKDPAHGAHRRWKQVDEEIGELEDPWE